MIYLFIYYLLNLVLIALIRGTHQGKRHQKPSDAKVEKQKPQTSRKELSIHHSGAATQQQRQTKRKSFLHAYSSGVYVHLRQLGCTYTWNTPSGVYVHLEHMGCTYTWNTRGVRTPGTHRVYVHLEHTPSLRTPGTYGVYVHLEHTGCTYTWNARGVCTFGTQKVYVHLRQTRCTYTWCTWGVRTPGTHELYVHLGHVGCTYTWDNGQGQSKEIQKCKCRKTKARQFANPS